MAAHPGEYDKSLADRVWHEAVDVVVLGLGAAGCAAAIEAHDAGASVLVLEKMPAGREGGNTRVSGGIWFDNRDPEGVALYLRSLCGDYRVPDEVIGVWAEETARNSEWLERLGASVGRHGNYLPEYPELPGSDAYGGYLGIDGQMGKGLLFELLSNAVRRRGITVLLDTPARELIQDPSTRTILGVAADQGGRALRVKARRGVVLATGGFENNPEMVHDYLRLPESFVWGTPAATGDGIKMAQKAGADLWHMDNMMAVVGLRPPGYHTGFFIMFLYANNFIYIGPDGTRFENELPQVGHGQAFLHGSYELFPSRPLYVIFDENVRLAGPISPPMDVLPVGWNMLVEGYRWSQDNSVEIDRGWIHKAISIKELAEQLGMSPAILEDTVSTYNEACAAGRDDQFRRDPETLVPLTRPPYYGFAGGPMLAWSNGGPRRNEKSQVLDAFGEVIPRLYAAGIVSSTYSWCKDGGFHIADALAFGRVAGRTVAVEAPLE